MAQLGNKEPKYRTPEERNALISKIAELRKTLTVKEACDLVGINHTTYYGWLKPSKKLKPAPKEKRAYHRRTPKQPELITLPVPEDNFLMLLWGKSSDVNLALEKIQRIQQR